MESSVNSFSGCLLFISLAGTTTSAEATYDPLYNSTMVKLMWKFKISIINCSRAGKTESFSPGLKRSTSAPLMLTNSQMFQNRWDSTSLSTLARKQVARGHC